ncbi:MAG TPA: hypothetical protein VFA50_11345 [Stellaceae bacterium]|nr:hypothetical protein [Stellaceae bacterium]
MSKAEQRGAEARREAQIVWSRDQQRNAEILEEREKARLAGAEKTARLRQLRLAREAELAAAAKPPRPRRKAAKAGKPKPAPKGGG